MLAQAWGHSSLSAVHVEGEGEGALAQALSLGLQLLQLTLRQPTELEDEPARRGGLAGVDMAADDNGEVLLSWEGSEKATSLIYKIDMGSYYVHCLRLLCATLAALHCLTLATVALYHLTLPQCI